LKEKVASPVYKTEITAVGIRRADHVTPLYPQKVALTSTTSGGRSVGIVSLRAKATDYIVHLHPVAHCYFTSTFLNTRRWPNWAETCCVILKFKV
jgi:hypothetical protein